MVTPRHVAIAKTVAELTNRKARNLAPRCNVRTVGREHGDGGRIIQASNPANFAPLNGRAIPERDSALTKRLAPIKLGVS